MADKSIQDFCEIHGDFFGTFCPTCDDEDNLIMQQEEAEFEEQDRLNEVLEEKIDELKHIFDGALRGEILALDAILDSDGLRSQFKGPQALFLQGVFEALSNIVGTVREQLDIPREEEVT